ncbi:chemotaxis response regulator protein-glutamate methylesterase [Tissierella praeacuta]|uniref:protein-glutamate methylesterase/protein-glutamine glutaminase n=1 Tax=Tissierella praeacuta TaxID=43131 RepID=UPI003341B2DD
MIKVLIVDDSALIRKILTDILSSDSEISVIGTAKNGQEALEKIEILKPDIVTLDIEMPLMDGLTTLKHIVIKHSNLPVIMISSLTSEGAELTLKALDEGAVDFLPKPTNVFSLSQEDIKREIIEKVKAGSRSKLYNRKPIKKISPIKIFKDRSDIIHENFNNIVAIGTSTGGPRALQTLIPELPANINASIVIVQHMPPKFTKSLADRLNSISNIRIKEAEEGDILSRGWGYIAPGDYHMTIMKEEKGLVIRLNKEPQVMGLRPTVDKMMESVARINGYSKTGVILTGMGSDGTKGIIEMRQAGSYTIAQDETTSVVFGMPKSAIATNCIDVILPIDKIADKIINKVGV